MATVTQTKLVGFCLGDKTNYNATNYANHIWFDPTNKQILLNGIEYIPKKLSELVNDSGFLTSITKSMVENVLTGNITSHTHSYLPLTGGTLTGALTCNGDYINMNNDSGSRGYRGFFNQSNSTSRASGSHIFMKGGGEALGTNSVSIGYQAYAGIRNKDSDATTYPYIAWQWMPSVKVNFTTTNQDTALGEFYGYEVLGGKMVQYELGGNTYTYENTSTYVRVLVCVKDDADTGLIFGGKSYMPFNATKTLIQGKYILARGESITNVNTITVGEVNYYVLAIYTWSATVGYDYSTQVKVMCATKVNNSNYNGALSYASGSYSVASGNSSVASGYSSVASGYSSVASGYYSVASGNYSVASGVYSVASGNSSVASGNSSVASGYSSVASGESSVASHDFSVVLARNGETQSSYQTIIGRYNAKVAGLFIIGNGSSSARSNALVVDESGNVTAKYFSGYANALGSEGIKVYATNSDEINFGGTSSSETIYFGYRSLDSRPTPTTYNFGKGTATLEAASFTGNAATATNADTLDGYHASSFLTATFSKTIDLNEISTSSIYRLDNENPNLPSSIFSYGNILTVKNATNDTAWQLIGSYSSDALWFRRGTWYAGGTGTLRTNAWKVIAFTDSNVATATALTSSAGSATQPIYFSNGKPVACTYTLGKSVPSDAVFTDTTYPVATASTNGLMSSAMFKAQMVKSVSVQQGAEMMKPDGTITITDHSVYITQDKSNINGVYQTASGDNNVKIPNATTTYDGSMSYTDKKKLDGISNYAPKKVVALRLSFNADGNVTVISGGGDYDMTQDSELMGSKSVEQTSVNNLYLTTIKLDTTASTTDTLSNLFRNSFVKFSFMGKIDSGISNYSITVKSNFDTDTLEIQFVSTKQDDAWVVDCVWEFF